MPAEDKIDAQRLLSPFYVMTYKSTESGVIARIEGEKLQVRPASCGRPLPPGKLEIVDADDNPLPAGLVGRIRLTWPAPKEQPADRSPSRAYPGDLGWLGGVPLYRRTW
ncbi:hypothetical protein [Paracoccus sp. (in: a-proteobacteria)]|uniref:hypothetical protein n=1 Tax=Paracoccus sp. TaxID=267 RepID=UPI002AFF59E1|nr:hypothetical protein [Paracoccus sp. (in: a-proteobacteria)]